MTKNDQRLSGTKEICQYCGRPWEVVLRWIQKNNFPASKIDGRYESLKYLIDQWFEVRITQKNDSPKTPVKT